MRNAKKLLAMLLCIVMCLSLFPSSAFSEAEAEVLEEEDAYAVSLEMPTEESEKPETEPVGDEPGTEMNDAEAIPFEDDALTADDNSSEADDTVPGNDAVPEDDAVPAADDNHIGEAEATGEPAQEPEADEDSPVSEQSVGEPYEFEDEDGVIHGFDGTSAEVSVAGVVEPDYPMVTGFSMQLYYWDSDAGDYLLKDSNTAVVDDLVRFTVWVRDQSYDCEITLDFGTDINNYKSIYFHSTGNYDGYSLSREWEGTYTFSQNDINGTYSVLRSMLRDHYYFYTIYHSDTEAAKKTLKATFPGTIDYQDGQDLSSPVEGVTLTENKKTLKAGTDALHLSLSIPGDRELESILVTFMEKEHNTEAFWLELQEGVLRYDPSTGSVTTTNAGFLLPNDLYNGTYYLSRIEYYDKTNSYYAQSFTSDNYWFKLTEGASPVVISDITCDRAGTSLAENESFTLSFRVDREILEAQISMKALRAADIKNTEEVYHGWDYYSFYASPVNSDSGLWEMSYSFSSYDVYGTYVIDSITVFDGEAYTTVPTNIMLSYQPTKTEVQEYLRLQTGEDTVITLFAYSYDVYDYSFSLQDEAGEEIWWTDLLSYTGYGDGSAYVHAGSRTGTVYLVAKATIRTGWTWEWDAYNEYWYTADTFREDLYRCRIDIVAGNKGAITQVSLPVAKANVELYSTDYTRVAVLPEMGYLRAEDLLVDPGELPVPEDNGWSLESARFLDSPAADLFELKVVDDRTLEIVPLYSTLMSAQEKASNVKSSYKSRIEISAAGLTEPFIVKTADGKKDAELSMAVKQTLPALKVNSLSFNSVISAYTNQRPGSNFKYLEFSGGTVTALEQDFEAAAKANKPAIPNYLSLPSYVEDDGSLVAWVALNENTPAAASGKLYLLATLDGWAIKKSVTVSYTVKATYPTVKYQPASITLNSALQDTSYTYAVVTPADFGGYFNDGYGDLPRFDFFISKITEGSGKTIKTYTNDTATRWSDMLNIDTYTYIGNDGKAYWQLTVMPGSALDTTNAHTFKVYSTLCGKETSFTVNAQPKQVTLRVTQSGTLQVNKYRSDSWNTGQLNLVPSLTNYNSDDVSYSYSIVRVNLNREEYLSVNRFCWNGSGYNSWDSYYDAAFNMFFYTGDENGPINIACITDNENILKTGTYYLETTAYFCDSELTVRTELNIEWVEPYTPTFTANVSGSLDVIRPGGSVISILLMNKNLSFDTYRTWKDGEGTEIPVLTLERIHTYKNALGKTVSETDILYLDDYESPFVIGHFVNAKGQWVNTLALKDSFAEDYEYDLVNSYKYKLRVHTTWKNGIPVYKSYNLPIKKGAAKVQVTPAAITLYAKDRLSQGRFDLYPTDAALSNIKAVEITGSSPFRLIPISGSTYAIGYKDNELPPGFKAGQAKTVKLSITFEGNLTGNSDTTVSVKVQIQ